MIQEAFDHFDKNNPLLTTRVLERTSDGTVRVNMVKPDSDNPGLGLLGYLSQYRSGLSENGKEKATQLEGQLTKLNGLYEQFNSIVPQGSRMGQSGSALPPTNPDNGRRLNQYAFTATTNTDAIRATLLRDLGRY